ncbi:MAG: phage tail sheath protein [Treponematales bacterium]
MAVPFKQIPAALLVPGQYQEIDNSLAGSVGDIKKALIIAYKSEAGTAVAGVPLRVLSDLKAAELFGCGSPAALLAKAFLELNKVEECWVLPVAEPQAGQKWQKGFTVSASAAQDGAVNIIINGTAIEAAAVTAGSDAEAIAAAIVARINSETSLPVEAEAGEDGAFHVKSVVRGTGGNRNSVTIESEAAGVSIAEGAVTQGTQVANIQPLFAGLGGVRYDYIVFDFDDPANIAALAAELDSRYRAMRQIGGRAFVALSGEIGSPTEAGSVLEQAETVNNPHLALIPRLQNPQLPGEWAAKWCAVASRILADDPAANTYDLQVPGLLAGEEVDADTRQVLLTAGVATWRLDSTGNVLIERLVTSYTENTDGGRDTSYLDIQVAETVDAVRTYINAMAKKRFATWKLASTEENFSAGAKVMSPGVFRSFLAELYSEVFIKEKQWCQDFDAYKSSIIVEVKAGSKTRLEYSHQPNLIGQFYIGAGLLQFK